MRDAPRFRVVAVERFERDVRLRMPFRFGVVTLTAAPQAFARARIRLGGREAEGAAAEMLAPKWFDKSPALSNEENFDQLRLSLAHAADAYRAGGENTAFGHWIAAYAPLIARGAAAGLNSLTACFGPALLDRAVLDAVCRLSGASFYDAIRENVPGVAAPPGSPELAGLDVGAFLASLRPSPAIAARHTVGLVDPIARGDAAARVDDGLPETLEEVVARYGHRWFKLKVGGDAGADVERLAAIASVLDRSPAPYRATLDGNEQYSGAAGVLELWRRATADPRLARLTASVAFIEQPIARGVALSEDVSALARAKPVIIDESDDSLEAFPRARRLGYTGVSSKGCKGLYKSLLNLARCAAYNQEAGAARFFMSAEDLTTQAGLAVQQDTALATILGLEHVERNGHHYVDGLASAPRAEQAAFLAAHPDLYEERCGAVRVRIADGALHIGSLAGPGFASGAMPDWRATRQVA